MPGRRPLPTEVKRLRGNPGKRKLNDQEPGVPIGEPEMPADLPELAQVEWKSIVPLLLQMGVLSKVDGKALVGYCYAWARLMQAEKEINDRGIILDEPVTDKEGNEIGTRTKANPACALADRAMVRMKSFLIEFGLTPASRSKLKVDKPKDADPVEAYLAKKMANAQQTVM